MSAFKQTMFLKLPTNFEVYIPQTDVCAFHPRSLRLHKACLQYRTAVITEQMPQPINRLKVNWKFLTQYAGVGLENGPSLA